MPEAVSLASLLRSLRERALLTQEELAQRAGLSVGTVRGLESGRIKRPRIASVGLLAETFELSEQDRVVLIAAARGHSAAPPAVAERPAGDGPVPAQLPPDVAGFIGRQSDLGLLDSLLPSEADHRGVVIATLDGAAGVGKTALAVHWAHRVRDRFPDGQLYINLRGYANTPPLAPIEGLASFLRALGVPAETVPADVDEASAMYRSLLADRRVLVVLDNAVAAEQVRPLLPGGVGCVVVVTSRQQLGGLVALDGARRIGLDVMTQAEAQELLCGMVAADRVRAEPQAVRELAALCGHLPLAVRIAAANLAARPRQTISDHLAQLRGSDRLASLAVAGDPDSAVAAAFDLSYRRLADPARRLFRLLGQLPGPDVTAEAAAALADISADQALALLEILVHARLMDHTAVGRFACHDLLRRYAVDRAAHEDSEPDHAAALARLLNWYLEVADIAATMAYPHATKLPLPREESMSSAKFDSQADALGWLESERANLFAAVIHAAEHGPPEISWLLADRLRGYWWQAGLLVDWRLAVTAALAASERAGDVHVTAALQLSLGGVWRCHGREEMALELYDAALATARATGWLEGQAAALTNASSVHRLWGRLAVAADQLNEALAISGKVGRYPGRAIILTNLGTVYSDLGEVRRAARCHARSMALHRALGSRYGETNSLTNLGAAFCDLGRLAEAEDTLLRALRASREFGHRLGEAHTLDDLAAVHRDAGRHAEALEAARAAIRLANEIGASQVEPSSRNTLGLVQSQLGRHWVAIDEHRHSLDLARRFAYRGSEIAALLGLATAHRGLGHREDVHSHAVQALDLARQFGFRLREGQALTMLANSHLDRGDLALAVEYGERALAIHQWTGHRIGEARTHLQLGHARQYAGATEAAHEHWQRSHALFTNIGTSEASTVDALLNG